MTGSKFSLSILGIILFLSPMLFMLAKNLSVKNPPRHYSAFPTPTPDTPLRNWNTYTDPTYDFTIAIPPGFTYETISFHPADKVHPYLNIFDTQYLNSEYNYPSITINIIDTPLSPSIWVGRHSTTAVALENLPKSDIGKDLFYLGLSDLQSLDVATSSALSFRSTNVSSTSVHTLITLDNSHLIDITNRMTSVGQVSEEIYSRLVNSYSQLFL